MARAQQFTYRDLVEHARDYMGANASGEAGRDAKRAIVNALNNLSTASRWTYFFQRYRLVTNAPYATGTVTYDHTGGTYERQLTLAGGSWPSWAALGTVVINNVQYEVADRKSSSVVTLSVSSNPGDDIASASAFSIYRDTYPLPIDFLAMGALIIQGQAVMLTPEHPSTWLDRQRINRGSGMPSTYCIRSDPNYQNTLCLSFYPPPDQAYTIDGIYQRTARQLNVEEYSTGTVTTTSGQATVTGSGTAWTSKLAGTIFRVTSSKTETPTGRTGDNPPAYERVVLSVDSATQLTLDDLIDETLAGVKYVCSDPVDVETNTMLTALLRGVEAQLGKTRRMTDRSELEAEYNKAVILAREADSRNFRDSRVGAYFPWPIRLADMPYGVTHDRTLSGRPPGHLRPAGRRGVRPARDRPGPLGRVLRRQRDEVSRVPEG